jgi:8-oxo-dGTP pyrophosphatase MutT (NUDIX family)/predicted GNAT family N-acyltransferase
MHFVDMKKCDCLLCKFENPKPTATAIVIKDQKLLVAKRAEEPFKGDWDFFGGYIGKNETPEEALKREVKEELGVDCDLTYVGTFTGTASFKDFEYPIVNFAYLTEIKGNLKLDKKENSAFSWVPIKDLKTIAFDSNQKILKFVKKKFVYDLEVVKSLVNQLDSSAKVNEESLYKAMFNGFVSKIEEHGKLVGMGWIFPRQTLLRKQAVVEDMIVDESQRGKGYGEKILLNLIDWAKKQGVEVVELTTNPKRIAANGLYQKVGFKLHVTNHYLLNLK